MANESIQTDLISEWADYRQNPFFVFRSCLLKISAWAKTYNNFHPHSSLKILMPKQVVEKYLEDEKQIACQYTDGIIKKNIFFASKEKAEQHQEKSFPHYVHTVNIPIFDFAFLKEIFKRSKGFFKVI